MRSLRSQLLLWLILMLTVAGALGGAAGYVIGLHEPNEEFDGQLRQLALYIGGGTAQTASTMTDGGDLEPEDVISVQIWDRGGRPVRNSDPTLLIPRQATTGFTDLAAAGDDWRVYTLVRPEQTVQIAQRTDIRKELATASALRAVYPVAVLIPLSWLLVGLIVSRVLRPLKRLVSDLAATQAGSGAALSLAGLPREIMPLVDAVNDLFARQKALLDFRQRFLSDTAHQLRTPLTASKLQAENLRHATSIEDARDLAADIERGLMRMSGMINQLLDLARADAPDRPVPTERHDLAHIVRGAIEDMIGLARRRSIDLGVTSQVHAPILCDRHDIRMLVDNLIDNAVRYTPTMGQVDIAVDVVGGQAILQITDTGSGIPESDLGRLFARFARFGRADIEGSGLGLAIVKAIATRHAARVEIQNRIDRRGLSATVLFPLAPVSSAPNPSAPEAIDGSRDDWTAVRRLTQIDAAAPAGHTQIRSTSP